MTENFENLDELIDRLKALREQCERQRAALESLWPGLVLDLHYASDDDDKDAMKSRIDTVIDALRSAPDTPAESPRIESPFPRP